MKFVDTLFMFKFQLIKISEELFYFNGFFLGWVTQADVGNIELGQQLKNNTK